MPAMTRRRTLPLTTTPQFSPQSLAGLVLWLDAIALAQANGTPVAAWADQSGLGNNASQGTAAAQPTYQATAINGRPGVVFDGVDDYMSIADASSLDTPAVTVACVFALPTNNINGSIWRKYTQYSFMPAEAGVDYGIAFANTTPGWAWIDTTVPIQAGPQVMIAAYQPSPAQLTFRLNSKTVLITSVAGAITSSTSSFVIGAWDDAGTPSAFLTGTVAALVVYNRALLSSELEAVVRWLGMRYGIGGG